MMTQTWALLVDAYRELNAKKLFWISLILSGLAIGVFALVGVTPRGLTIAGTYITLPAAWGIYKYMYSTLIIGFWLTWGAMILALISTSTMLPDLIASGTIDLYVSRPISRIRLFLTKYVSGLLFAAVQVAVVAVGSLFIIRWRGGEWIPSLLLAVPLVVLMFSYVFAVTVLIGTWTRSSIAATLLGLLAWGFFSSTQYAEQALWEWQKAATTELSRAQDQIRDANADLDHYKQNPLSDLMGIKAAYARSKITSAAIDLPELEHGAHLSITLHNVSKILWTIVPKTRETSDLLDRYLLTDNEAGVMIERREQRDQQNGRPNRINRDEADAELIQELRHRSVPLIIGSSLAFELVTLSLAGWIFCRRDY
jgi:hypothetical protein